MEQPTPVDVSRLKNILGGARQVMRKVESGEYSEGNISLNETVSGHDLVESPQGMGSQAPQQMSNTTNNPAPKMMNGAPVYKNMNTSKMPDSIKQAMMETPIPQMSGPNHTFNLDDVSDLVEDKPMPMNYRPPKPQSNQPIRENVQMVQQNTNDTFTVSESALRGIVKDVVNEVLLESYTKSLTENAIKKTINTLIKEGKIKTKNR